jgi:hypothetical protein
MNINSKMNSILNDFSEETIFDMQRKKIIKINSFGLLLFMVSILLF